MAVAEAFRRPNIEMVRATFAALSSDDDRTGLHLMLMATGDFNAMASDRLGTRLYGAIARFQQREGLVPTGIPDPVTMARAHGRGDAILSALRLHAVDHPGAAASLFVPGAFGLVATPTPRGLATESADRSMSLDFSFFPIADSTMANIFARLSAARPGRRIDREVIRDGVFAVAGGGEALGFTSRYISGRGRHGRVHAGLEHRPLPERQSRRGADGQRPHGVAQPAATRAGSAARRAAPAGEPRAAGRARRQRRIRRSP